MTGINWKQKCSEYVFACPVGDQFEHQICHKLRKNHGTQKHWNYVATTIFSCISNLFDKLCSSIFPLLKSLRYCPYVIPIKPARYCDVMWCDVMWCKPILSIEIHPGIYWLVTEFDDGHQSIHLDSECKARHFWCGFAAYTTVCCFEIAKICERPRHNVLDKPCRSTRHPRNLTSTGTRVTCLGWWSICTTSRIQGWVPYPYGSRTIEPPMIPWSSTSGQTWDQPRQSTIGSSRWTTQTHQRSLRTLLPTPPYSMPLYSHQTKRTVHRECT